ncbi:histidyl-tRNA synthetase [Candidatus Hakubella thermalkaliphila]|uniref:Histidine--tRNA ligase n=2 Tax=Candidatus Hakubella thermalkaliphila TaxID=2754717 RepID=A0A6V8PSB3_9ACTN|nr:histidine--tRNA ligase [Candidatus Hakubella thermalkaliphila]GFP34704.1 histidyl-tRNA synthetase [Candidatus Hakubella thermalkaliphila]
MVEPKYVAPTGTSDILYPEVERRNCIVDKARRLLDLYCYQEMIVPTFEHTELFVRGIGEATDIVSKEMYTFGDQRGSSFALRPEATSGIVRAFIEHSLYTKSMPQKYFCIGPMFRKEKPQAGRYREFYQIDVELLGAAQPSVDAEVIALLMHIFQDLGLKNLTLKLNSMGCRICRAPYREELVGYLRKVEKGLCRNCRERIKKNPLRVFDCKVEGCRHLLREAPELISVLCAQCQEHFEEVKKYLGVMGLDYELDPKVVRGLDYYTRSVFEVVSPSLGAQNVIGAGGRYDYLVEDCGGPPIAGLGFAIGIDRTSLAMKRSGLKGYEDKSLALFIITTSHHLRFETIKRLDILRHQGFSAEMDHLSRSMKAQMRLADKLRAKIVIFIGEDEIRKGVLGVRDMATSSQEEVPFEDLLDYLYQKLGRKEKWGARG